MHLKTPNQTEEMQNAILILQKDRDTFNFKDEQNKRIHKRHDVQLPSDMSTKSSQEMNHLILISRAVIHG